MATDQEKAAREGLQGRWILRWKDGAAEDMHEMSNRLCAEAHGGPAPEGGAAAPPRFRGTCLARYSHVFQGLSGRFSDDDMAALVAAYGADIAYVQRAQLMRKAALQTQAGAVWGLARLSADTLPSGLADGTHSYEYRARGTGVHVYVIDSGVRASLSGGRRSLKLKPAFRRSLKPAFRRSLKAS